MTFTVPEIGTTSPFPSKIGGNVNLEPPPATPKTPQAPPQPVASPGDTTTPLTPTPGLTADQQSARGVLNTELANFGLSSLGDTVWNWYLEGRSIDQIMLDIRNTPEYKARFPAMQTLAQRGQAITEAQYVDYEKTTTQILRSAGIDPSFFDVTQGLVNNVAPTELNDRVKLAESAVYQAPQAEVQFLRENYGLSTGDLAAYFIDPNKALPMLQQNWAASQIGGQAGITGYGSLNAAQAGNLAALGVSESQAQTGFSKLAQERQLFQALPGENFAGIGTDTQLSAQFGQNAVAQQAIEQERQKRLAEFKAGGSFATGTSSSGQGIVGV